MNYIFFNADMIELIKAGKKTQTRRPVRSPECCYGKPGDMLKVFKWYKIFNTLREKVGKEAFNKTVEKHFHEFCIEIVSIEKRELYNMAIEEVAMEGFPGTSENFEERADKFFDYWDTIYGATKYASVNNPEVWVIEFKVVIK